MKKIEECFLIIAVHKDGSEELLGMESTTSNNNKNIWEKPSCYPFVCIEPSRIEFLIVSEKKDNLHNIAKNLDITIKIIKFTNREELLLIK